MNGKRAPRLIALAAAYAVAFSALLPALAALRPPLLDGDASFGIICSAGASGGSSDHGVPAKPQPPCPCPGCCAMPGCGAAMPLCDGLAVVHPIGAGFALARFAPAVAELQSMWRVRNNPARAPPLV
jgi:hypothetical protein